MLDISQHEGLEAQEQFESKYGKGKAIFTHCDVSKKDDFKG